jgi:hypothetical protein
VILLSGSDFVPSFYNMNREDNLSLSTALLIFAHSDKVQSALKPIAYNKRK